MADQLQSLACAGGAGDEFERAVGDAFAFLGFDSRVMGGPGRPDVLLDAAIGKDSYRVLLDAKSRGGGVVSQNDVNFESLRAQKTASGARHTAVVGPDFAGGNLEQWAEEHGVRLITVEDLRQLLLAHAVCPLPLDAFGAFFRGGGSTDDGALSDLVAESESILQMMELAHRVYRAVCDHQESDATLDVNALYFILEQAYSSDMIEAAVAFLRSEVIGAVGVSETDSLYTRLAPAVLDQHLGRLRETMRGT